MKNCTALETRHASRFLPFASLAAFGVAFTIGLSQPAEAHRVLPPPMPANLQLPAGVRPFLDGHAVGTQNYICLPSGSAFAWVLFGPQATLFNDNDQQVMTHFLSSNPFESGMPRASWQNSRDTSTVWAALMASSSDSKFVAPGAIPWLLLQVVGAQDGPTGGRKLTATTYIQRLNTSGGAVPSTGCAQALDVGKRALVPYTADYFFYKYPGGDKDEDN